MEHTIYDFTVTDIDGNDVSLERFKGSVLLIVNVASKCGFTPQYEGLQNIYEHYRERGLYILGFPANNFLRQEPGSNEEIKQFCSLTYNVGFPMFQKISVKGKDIAPLYGFLTGKKTNPRFHGSIKWNFTKFLVDRKGTVIGRFEPKTKPDDEAVTKRIEAALGE
ncbi:MAG: glutathione peroxidase [Spirochaetales bacterium]|nr:glutathione peroxidase [Spirochaetales bacterium]